MEYSVQRPQETQEYRVGRIIPRVCKLQSAAKKASETAAAARERGDWDSFAYHSFYFGRLCQGLHQLKDEHNLDISIPEPANPHQPTTVIERLPVFISDRTTGEFPEL